MFVATSFSSRAGVSKCGARFETLLRVPTQWCAERFWGGVPRCSDRNRWCYKNTLQRRLQRTAPL